MEERDVCLGRRKNQETAIYHLKENTKHEEPASIHEEHFPTYNDMTENQSAQIQVVVSYKLSPQECHEEMHFEHSTGE
jgi:hypothetical protein